MQDQRPCKLTYATSTCKYVNMPETCKTAHTGTSIAYSDFTGASHFYTSEYTA